MEVVVHMMIVHMDDERSLDTSSKNTHDNFTYSMDTTSDTDHIRYVIDTVASQASMGVDTLGKLSARGLLLS